MSEPFNKTDPAIAADGINSCMRFKSRMKVDFPHPDGPIKPVTVRSGNRSETFDSA